MNAQLWSWILMAAVVTGVYLAGRRCRISRATGLASQLLWPSYSNSPRQWGLVSCLPYGVVHLRNLIAWKTAAVLPAAPNVQEPA
jgi:hypothetical protein